ncbi:MAG: phosphate signaling complex protein PhoU [Halofilum sp. (in: g-proteobacteria)]
MDKSRLGQHISQEFDAELEQVRNKAMAMGGLVEQQLHSGLRTLLEGNHELGLEVVSGDYPIDALEVEIDEDCTRLIARRQPAAGDLRTVVALMKVITDLERIGDEAEKLGRFGIDLAQEGASDRSRLVGVQHLGEHVRRMLHEALDAFARLDVEAALRVADQDTSIDPEYEGVVRHLITHMMEDPRTIKSVLAALWCARALERVGDHARNICEYVVYMVEGRDIRHGGSPRRGAAPETV